MGFCAARVTLIHMDKADDGGQQKQMEEDFLAALADYTPTVPEEVTDFYLKRAGFSSSDPTMYSYF